MKRPDTFMLGMSAFLAANCISYFAISQLPHVTGWGMRPGMSDYLEAIGFPFVVLSVAKTQTSFSLVNCLGNLVVAVLVSYFLARHLAHRLPPLWPGHCRTFRYSLCGFLLVTSVHCLLLGIAMAGPGWGLTVRNLTCLAGPPTIYAWYLHRRKLGWTRLATAAVGLTLLAILIGYRYEDPFFFADRLKDVILFRIRPGEQEGMADWNFTGLHFAGLTIIRAVVPVFGLMLSLVIVHAAYDGIRNPTAFVETLSRKVR